MRFAVVGTCNTALDVAVFCLLHFAAGWPVLAANSTSYALAIISSYLCNRHWTFADSCGKGSGVARFVLFVAVNAVGLGLSNLTVWLLVPAIPTLAAKLLAVLVTFCWNYLGARHVVYR